jgi:hypothetical protein
MLVKDTPYYELYEQAAKCINDFKPKEIKEIKLLTQAFNATILKREVYEPKYARVLYSNVISLHDKEKAVFNPGKEAIAAIADLPLKVAQKTMLPDKSWLGNVALYRKSEQGKIVANLGYNMHSAAYRTLCLCSDSKYILKMYARALKSMNGLNVESINVIDLASYEIEPTANNVFVRSIDEDRNNIFLIYVFGDVANQVIDNIKGFLQTEKRSKFHLGVPNVTIDLSNVLPIVLCDKHNMQKLADVCDMVEVADVGQNELQSLVADMVESKRREYCLTQVKCAEDIMNVINNMTADEIETCIDNAIRAEATKSDVVLLDKDILTKYKYATTKLGNIGFCFGGTDL